MELDLKLDVISYASVKKVVNDRVEELINKEELTVEDDIDLVSLIRVNEQMQKALNEFVKSDVVVE